MTEGLVCDHASETDAVMMLTDHGDSLQTAPRNAETGLLYRRHPVVSVCENSANLLQQGQRLSDPQSQGLGRWYQDSIRHNYAVA
jgi:hypothetical protein